MVGIPVDSHGKELHALIHLLPKCEIVYFTDDIWSFDAIVMVLYLILVPFFELSEICQVWDLLGHWRTT